MITLSTGTASVILSIKSVFTSSVGGQQRKHQRLHQTNQQFQKVKRDLDRLLRQAVLHLTHGGAPFLA